MRTSCLKLQGLLRFYHAEKQWLDFFTQLAAAPLCGDPVKVNRFKMEQAVCLSDQRARLTVCSPNKPEPKFSMLQIPKHHSQVKGKTAGAAISRFLPCTLLWYQLWNLWWTRGERAKSKATGRACLKLLSLCSRASQGIDRIPKTSIPQSSSKYMAPSRLAATSLHWSEVCPDILNLIRYSVSSQRASKVQGGFGQ